MSHKFPIVNIANVNGDDFKSQISLSIAPGKKKEDKYDRDLDDDLDTIYNNSIDVIVCLLEWSEMLALGIEDYPMKAQNKGFYFYHLPIKDHHVPIIDDTEILVSLILKHVHLGHNILIHCSGGVGRSAVIVSCCLCKLGYKPEDSITAVRDLRVGAIKNSHQLRFVKNYYFTHCI